MFVPRRAVVMAIGLSALATLAPARASIMMALSLPELVQRAEHIAVVEVGSVKAAWDARHERIYSTIDLKVIERWKSPAAAGTAAPADRLTVVQPGGTVDDITMTVTGLGTFVPGERTLVFLRGPADHAQVVGMTQGKRPLRYESTSRRWLVAPPDLRDAKLVGGPTSVTPTPIAAGGKIPSAPSTSVTPAASLTPAPAPSRDMLLDDMRIEIKRLVGTAAK